MKISARTPQRNRSGFSLVEVVIAIGIVAVLLTSFMAVFGPAQQNVSRALGVGDVNRLTSTLENELGYVRETESQTFDNAFAKAFDWVSTSTTARQAVVVYQYQADPERTNQDGTLAATTIQDVKKGTAGVDFITQTVARKVDTSAELLTEELKPGVITGSVYAVRLTQLKNNSTNGSLEVGTLGTISLADGNGVSTPTAYTDGYLAFQAEFFKLPNNLAGYVTGGAWDFDKLGAPIVTQNIAVRK